jgi:hypothetical protein
MIGSIRRILALILTALLLVACNLPHNGIDLGAAPATDTPANQPCFFNWDAQSLPDLSAQVQAGMEAAGLRNVTVRAEAYGESCYDSQTNEPVSFGAMETDFHITVKVADLADKDNLGNSLEKILVVLDKFPTGTTPGPQPGYIGISFRTGSDELNLWFIVTEGKSAREDGLLGAALLDKLLNR